MISASDIMRVKGKGFLLNRGTQTFSGRIVTFGGVFTAEQMAVVAECAKRYGNGKAAVTSRMDIEIVGIPYEKIDDAIAFVEENGAGLRFGGTGAKIRPVVACKGTTCVYGNIDTQALAKKIHEEYYVKWADVKLPHKFKIGIGGCPNSCAKPSLNDFGVEGHRVPVADTDRCRGCKVCQVEAGCPVHAAGLKNGKLYIDRNVCLDCGVCRTKCPFGVLDPETKPVYRVFVGGTWGKKTRAATVLPGYASEDEIMPLLEKAVLWFRSNAYQKERLGAAIDRVGVEQFIRDMSSDELLQRRDEILAAEIMTR